ncbi:putative aminoacyltransferase FemX [Mycoplasma sp. CAG:877]|mgnify:FL=1|nr:putative aminoacyltransferase FemX [Mycoplasma sp. CAG:877]
MLRLKNLDKEVYDNYVKSHKDKSHFLHSESLTEFIKVENNLTPYYLGLVSENDEIVCATTIFQEYLKMNYCRLYIPAGFIMDYKNKYLLKTMTKKIVGFAISKKALSIEMSPYISDNLKDEDKSIIIENLKAVGFKQTNKSSDIMLKEKTERIDLTEDMETIENNFSNEIKDYLTKAISLETEVIVGSKKDLDFLYEIMLSINKEEVHSKDYYETLYEILNGNNYTKATIILGKINLTKTIKSLEKKIKRTSDQMSIIPIDSLTKSSKDKLANLTKQKEELTQELEKFRIFKQEHSQESTICAHLLIEHNDKAWLLYDYNKNVLEETYLKYYTYYKDIKYCKDHDIKYLEQISPSILTEFNAKTIESIGTYTYKVRPITNFIITKIFLK